MLAMTFLLCGCRYGNGEIDSESSFSESGISTSTVESEKEPSSSEPEKPPVSSSEPEKEPTGGGTPDVPNTEKVCYLTFDDGPSDNTLKILDTLKKHGAVATFFVVGNAKIQYIPKIIEGGNAVGLHSNTHNYGIYASADTYFADINALSDKIYNVAGIRPQILRFPGGTSNTISQGYSYGIMKRLSGEVVARGYNYFDWNVSSGDAQVGLAPKDSIVRSVLEGARGKTGICVLMHDAAAKTTTAEALPEIIEGLREMGFKFRVLTKETVGFKHYPNN